MNHPPSQQDWYRFVRILLLTLGIGFTIAGIIFFFAYNWEALPKFAKLSLTGGLLIATTLLSLRPQFDPMIRNILLTAAAALVGVLFAVYGQIYQTGANAYDFFLAWTVFISIWVLVANFPPLWVLYLLLINTTILLYANQVANHWSDTLVFTLLFLVNLVALIVSKFLMKAGKSIPTWFTNLVALAAISFSTIGITTGMFRNQDPSFWLLLLLAVLAYAAGIWYGLHQHSIFYLSIIPVSLIIIGSAWFLKISNDAGSFLFISLFIIGSASLTIKFLLDLQKKWAHEQS
ncbi:MAG: DUF2157 domain-containing protein [Flavipsychrobacter sp.]|nr:DUF2157 domain-containing protein [Flavipsychrobacter sp.]